MPHTTDAPEASPGGDRLEVHQQVGTDALRHCPSDRYRSDIVTDVGSVSIAVPLAATRTRDELEVAPPCSSFRSPPARRSDAELALCSGSAA
jgi:hypothetical protein